MPVVVLNDEIEKNLAFADKAFAIWKKDAPDNGETFEKVLNGLHTAYEALPNYVDKEQQSLFAMYVLAISRDLVDELMATLFRLALNPLDLTHEYYDLLSKEDVIKEREPLLNKLQSLDKDYQDLMQKSQNRASQLIAEDGEMQSFQISINTIASFKKEYDKFNGVARGLVESFEEAEKKIEEYQQKQADTQPEA